MPIHNEAKPGEIAKTVIMPGDPLRAKYIAENFLEDYKLVNTVRNMYAYTGKYKGKEITVMAHGMGMPSVGIYSMELYKFYGVENIIRIGTCGAYTEDLHLLDVILVDKSYTEGNFAYGLTGNECHLIEGSKELTDKIEETAKENGINYTKGNIACTESFDPYLDDPLNVYKRIPKDLNILGAEMESFALFFVAKMYNRKASCILTVVDSLKNEENVSSEDRQKSLNNMITLALETSLKL
ncbi:MAG: purine-nucleoside phosphorylase [Clostridia bacterium]|nr:purine-nucleoside phosphorylase [Clostridia bacterium]